MFHRDTKFHIGGLPLRIISSEMSGNQFQITAEIILSGEFNHMVEVDKLFDNIFVLTKPKDISELIVDWYIRSKIQLRQNVVELASCKRNLFAAQLRKLFRSGETWAEIVSTLSFSMFDNFWSPVVARNYRILAGGQDKDKTPIYFKVKDQMIERQETKAPEVETGDGNELDY